MPHKEVQLINKPYILISYYNIRIYGMNVNRDRNESIFNINSLFTKHGDSPGEVLYDTTIKSAF